MREIKPPPAPPRAEPQRRSPIQEQVPSAGLAPDETEATALVGLAKASKQESRCGKLNIRSRKTNRMFRANQLGSDLLGRLSEFLASRNVINQTERYEKIGAAPRRQRGGRVRETDLRQPAGRFACPQLQSKWPGAGQRTNRDGAWEAAGAGATAERVKKFDHCDRWNQKGKREIGRLLADLLSGRQGNRLIPLLKLLRAPVVLAALFSFGLAVSLIVLYTLSFHHCQTQRLIEAPIVESLGRRPDGQPARAPMHADRNGDSETSERSVTVQTECGSYEGRPEGGALKFRGIAYASPPVGPRRWRKPRPIWLDEALCPRDSRWPEQVARGHCVQLSPFNHRVSGSEDCLYLDIYTPARLNQSDAKSLQVSHRGAGEPRRLSCAGHASSSH
jgi:hypothetical protein